MALSENKYVSERHEKVTEAGKLTAGETVKILKKAGITTSAKYTKVQNSISLKILLH